MSPLARAGGEEVDAFLERWMSVEVVQQSRVWDILIPGSHDSGTYDCTHEAKGVTQRGLMEFIKSFVQTQDKCIYDQLVGGVRFLDLRVCVDPLSQTKIPYCAHGGYRCVTLIDALLDVRKFVEKNATEVVLLSLKPDAGFKTGPYHMTLGTADFWVSALLWDHLGDKLRSGTRVQELIERKQNVIYFFSEVERYVPPNPFKQNLNRLASQCSVKLEHLDSALGSAVIPRNLKEQKETEDGVRGKKIIRYESGEYYSHHKPSAKHKDLRFEGSEWDLFTGVVKSYVVKQSEGKAESWSEEVWSEEGGVWWELDRAHFDEEYAFRYRCGELHAARARRANSLDHLLEEARWDLPVDIERFVRVPRDLGGSFRLRPQDSVRYKQMGLSRTFFEFPLKTKLGPNFLFISFFRTGRTILTKSWGQTCENNLKFLISKLKYWAKIHGKSIPRPPYRFRLLAAEITPPSPDFPQPGTDLMKFWATQSANALFFLPTGVRPNALSCNKSLLSEILVPSIVSQVNGITHDFVSRKLILTMLFHHIRFLKKTYAETPELLGAGRTGEGPIGEEDEDPEGEGEVTTPQAVVTFNEETQWE